eukprot:m51a1_g2952 hypothetical protein (528) ;mRNA; f:642237-644544
MSRGPADEEELLPQRRVVIGEGLDGDGDGDARAAPAAPGSPPSRTGPVDPSNAIRVEVWAPSFVGSDVVSGNVFLDVSVPFYAQGVEAQLVGYEKVHFQAMMEKQTEGAGGAGADGSRSPPHAFECLDRVELFKRTERLSPHEGTYSAGKYVFPFAFPLPAVLPGVYWEKAGNWGMGSGFAAKVMYKLRATVLTPAPSHLACAARLVVNDRFDAPPQPSAAEVSFGSPANAPAPASSPPPPSRALSPLARPLSPQPAGAAAQASYASSSSSSSSSVSASSASQQLSPRNGDLAVKARLDKAAYFPGERVIVRVRANSTLKRPVPRVSIRAVHTLWLNARGCKRCLTRDVHAKEAEGFPPCFLGVRHLWFDLPLSTPPSTAAGALVRSSYAVELSFDVGGQGGADGPAAARSPPRPGGVTCVTLPLTVLAPHLMFAAEEERRAAVPLLTAVPADASYRSPWVADEDTQQCSSCKAKFKLYLRRHHCRHCGQIFCDNCTKNRSCIVKLEYMTPAQAGGVIRTGSAGQYL